MDLLQFLLWGIIDFSDIDKTEPMVVDIEQSEVLQQEEADEFNYFMDLINDIIDNS